MLIEVYADFSCPWCFVGRRRLARARVQRPQLQMQVVWQPFQLNPEVPRNGIDRAAFVRGKMGGSERNRALEVALEESGGKEGIRFAFDRIRRIPNTLDAHALMRLAGPPDVQDLLAEALFTAYFEQGRDIGQRETLLACAESVGMDRDMAAAGLNAGTTVDAVVTIDELARQGGIGGVPYFVFDRRYALAGAQDPAAFLPLFDALAVGERDFVAEAALTNA